MESQIGEIEKKAADNIQSEHGQQGFVLGYLCAKKEMGLHKYEGSDSLPPNYHFSNENGKEVTVLATVGEWCMVCEEGKKKPYALRIEFIKAIYDCGHINP